MGSEGVRVEGSGRVLLNPMVNEDSEDEADMGEVRR